MELTKRKRGLSAWTVGIVLAASPLSSALAALTVYAPAQVLMIDGIDGDVTVNVGVGDITFPAGRYDFGFLVGSTYTAITSTAGSYVFNGGDLVNFALHDTVTDSIYDIANPANYATQIYKFPIDPSDSRNPIVTDPYYRLLALFWDLDGDGNLDTGFDLTVTTPLVTHDGMAPVVIPVPAAVWLFGSGLFGLAAAARRRRR